MATPYGDTAIRLRQLALAEPVALVLFSGGKDSLVLADLCSRVFKRIVLVHLYLVPGLACVEEMLDAAKARWGVEVYQHPEASLATYLRKGICCFPAPSVPEISPPEVREFIRHDLGVRLMMHGAKKSDSLIMRRKIKADADKDLIYALRAWNRWDILAYLSEAKITAPEVPDIGLGPYNLCWLHDHRPDDFRLLAQVFPFAEAFVKRRDWYGVEGKHKIR